MATDKIIHVNCFRKTKAILSKISLLLIIFTLGCGNLLAQKKVYSTTAIDGVSPRIDGILDDEAWEHAVWGKDFVQREPYQDTAPTQQTQFKLIYDNNNIYIAIRAFDTAPDSIVKRMSRRDGFEGDWVEVNIDSYHDLRTAFSFGVNAAGVKGDEFVTNDSDWDPNWNPIWYVKTSIDNEGWVAEMQIPLSQLRFGKQKEYVWGFQVNRRLYRKEEQSSWQYISPESPGWVHLFGELHGIKNIDPKKQREITPFVLGGIETYQRDVNNPYAPGKELIGSIGLDGKWGVTNDFTLDFTINPDFGQVEADPSEVNLTVFETKFNERRPFFIEGSNILSLDLLDGGGPLSSDNLFYSRRLGRTPSYYPDLEDDEYMSWPSVTHILGAAKLSGKTRKGLSLGVMETVTKNEIALISKEGVESEVSVEPLTNYLVARVQQDLNKGNTQIGGMITTTHRFSDEEYLMNELHKTAFSAGLDFEHQWKSKTYYLKFNAALSNVKGSTEAISETQSSAPHFFQRPDASHLVYDSARLNLMGYGGSLQFGKAGNGKLRYTIWITGRSPGLHLNDIGFHKDNDHIQQVAWMGYQQNEPIGVLRRYNINVNQWVGYTFGGENLYVGANTNAHWTFVNYWRMGFNVEREFMGLNTDFLRGGPALKYDGKWNTYMHFGTDDRKKFKFYFETSHNRTDGNTANRQSYYVGVRWQVADAFKINLTPGYSKRFAEREWVNSADYDTDTRYVLGSIDQVTTQLTFRLSYNISPDFTIEFYAMPFISAGSYSQFKYVTNPKATAFADRYTWYSDEQLSYNESDEVYHVDENRDGGTDYSFDQPNFNVFDFNSNLVLRWEYLPGSIVYLVWSQSRSEYLTNGNFKLGDDIETLFGETYPHNVILLKFSYRIGN